MGDGTKVDLKLIRFVFLLRIVRSLQQHRDLTRTIVHVDMDMFYAAVEMRDDPRLQDIPMAVGGE